MASEKKRGDLGRVVVIGGNGFLGHHIINQILESWTTTAVASIDLRCERNRNAAASYKECDITDTEKLQSALEDLKPDVVIHTASPVAVDDVKARALYEKVNVQGTQSVVEACQRTGVKALVYTSSSSVISDGATDLYNADERWPVIRGDQQKEYYSETKAAAEELVLKANRAEPYPNFLTTSIRPAGIFGEGDAQLLQGFYNAYRTNKSRIQIGENTNLFDFTYVGNVAHAHLLAAQLLLATAKSSTRPLDHEKADGEAFIITNDSPVYFWDFARAVYRASGDEKGLQGRFVMNQTVGYVLGFLSEVFASIVRKTPTFTVLKVTMTCMTRYFNIGKAKRVLRYEPLWTLQEGLERGMRGYAEHQATKI